MLEEITELPQLSLELRWAQALRHARLKSKGGFGDWLLKEALLGYQNNSRKAPLWASDLFRQLTGDLGFMEWAVLVEQLDLYDQTPASRGGSPIRTCQQIIYDRLEDAWWRLHYNLEGSY